MKGSSPTAATDSNRGKGEKGEHTPSPSGRTSHQEDLPAVRGGPPPPRAVRRAPPPPGGTPGPGSPCEPRGPRSASAAPATAPLEADVLRRTEPRPGRRRPPPRTPETCVPSP